MSSLARTCLLFLTFTSVFSQAVAKSETAESSKDLLVKLSPSYVQHAKVLFANSFTGYSIEVSERPLLETEEGTWIKVSVPHSFATQFENELNAAEGVLAVANNSRLYSPAGVGQESKTFSGYGKPPLPKPKTEAQGPDTYQSKLYAHTITKADTVRNLAPKELPIVAIVDSGIDYTHEDLVGNLWHNTKEIPGDNIDNDNNGFVDDVVGWDFLDNDNLPYDSFFHGTHIAGVVGAVTQNSLGVAGMIKNVKLMTVKMMDPVLGGTVENAIESMVYAARNGASVIVASWGHTENNLALKDAVTLVGKSNVLFVTSAGNDWMNTDHTPYYPACFDNENLISVAATDERDYIPAFSNYGFKGIHLGAPGTNIFSTMPSNKYDNKYGTSFSTPQVAGAAALLKSQFPKLSAVEIKKAILQGVDKVPQLQYLVSSHGRLNVNTAYDIAKSIAREKEDLSDSEM